MFIEVYDRFGERVAIPFAEYDSKQHKAVNGITFPGVVVEAKPKEVEEFTPPEPTVVDREKARWEQLKSIGWNALKGESRAEYKALKAKYE